MSQDFTFWFGHVVNTSTELCLAVIITNIANYLHTFRLHKTQDLLYDSTRDFLEQRYQGRADEREWMAEKDKLLRQLDACKQQLTTNTSTHQKRLNISTFVEDVKAATAEELKVTSFLKIESTQYIEMIFFSFLFLMIKVVFKTIQWNLG